MILLALLLSQLASAGEPTTHRLEMTLASEAKVPVLGWQYSAIQSTSLVTLTADGGWTHRVCTVDVSDRTPLAETEIPRAFVGALPPVGAVAEIDEDVFRVDLGTSAVGWDPALSDTVPPAADASGVIDHEGDGRPGATVVIRVTGFGSVAVEVAQQSHTVLVGQRTDTGWSGRIETRSLEQVVYGADHRLMRRTPELRPRDADSHFVLTPTDATDCDELQTSLADAR